MKTKIYLIVLFVTQTFHLFGQTIVKEIVDNAKAEQLLNDAELVYNKAEYNEAIAILNNAFELGKSEFDNSKSKEEKYFSERLLADICSKMSDCYIHLGNKELAREWLIKSGNTYRNPWSLLRYAKAYDEGKFSLNSNEEKKVSVKFDKKKKYMDASTACLFAVNFSKLNINMYGDSEQMKKKLEDEYIRVKSASESQLGSKIQTKTVSY